MTHWREKYKHGNIPPRNAIICYQLFNRDNFDFCQTEDMQLTQIHDSVVIVSFNTNTRKFCLNKDRYGYRLPEIVSKMLGFEITDEGKFINEQDELMFILRTQ